MTGRPRILNADDHDANRSAVSRMLEGAGFEPIEAESGAEALRRASEGPDAVLLNLSRADLGGFEVCRRLRADPRTRDLPVVHLTSTYGTPDAGAAALEAGADVYLTDPVEPLVLVSTLRSLLRRRAVVDGALAETRRRLEDAQQIAHLGSWEWDAQTNELIWSDELYRIFGLDSATRLSLEGFLEKVHPEDRDFVAALHDAAIREGQSFEYYGRIVRAGGEVRHLHVRGEASCGDDGRVVRVAGVAHDITDRARSEGSRRRLGDRLIKIQEEERRRLARELHDEVGQTLTALQLMIAAAGRSAASRTLGEAAKVVGDLLSKVRDLSLDLRPPMLDDFGLAAALQWHVDRFSRRTAIEVDLAGSALEGRFSAEAELAAFRVVQEALTNVARHSGAGRAEVRVTWDSGVLNATVADAGRGCDGAGVLAGTSTGLPGLRERIEVLGGRFELVSGPGAGTRITARIPAVRQATREPAAGHSPPRRAPAARRSTNRQTSRR